MKTKLTVAIPVRWTDERNDILARLEFVKLDVDRPKEVEILVIDDGSARHLANQLLARCGKLGFSYHRIDSEHLPFSIGRARNEAAIVGQSRYLMFQDVDLMPYPGFFSDILRECAVSGLDDSIDNFIMVSVIYLTEEGTAKFMKTTPTLRRQYFIHSLLQNDQSVIEKFSTGTSVTVWCRDYYLATGGNDPDFNGWGYEDLEYACRAIRRRKKFPLPSEFSLDYRNFSTVVEYKGWKSIYRLFGDLTFQKGIVLFHAWHRVDQNTEYMGARTANRKVFEAKMAAFRDHGIEPDPLPALGSGKSLVLRNNTWVANRWVSPFFGELVHIEEDKLTPDTLISFLISSGFDRVIFHNPYANERMLSLYLKVKENRFPYIVVERGALPDSVFFDPAGFNADSDSYHERHWNHQLSDSERHQTFSYMQKAIAGDDSLEQQPTRKGKAALRRGLKIGRGMKTLVAFLQRPSDTVIQHFMGELGSYDEFLRLLGRLPFSLPHGWVLLVKQHPLETMRIDIPGAINADDRNTKDLLELADAMIAVNSGVGVLAMIFGVPVLYCGNAFYGTEGIARKVTDERAVNDALENFVPDREKTLRFINFLVNKFYSFGVFETRKVPWHDGSIMTATTDINYYILRLPNRPEIKRTIRTNIEVSNSSILFDRYRMANGNLDFGARQVRITSNAENAKSVNAPASAVTRKKHGVRRKLKKLFEDPARFFRESRYSALRLMGNKLIRN